MRLRYSFLKHSNPHEIKTLFAYNETGVWYDPSDISTLFQDSVGLVPVTLPGQPVGLVLDKSKKLSVGQELLSNTTFDTDISGWASAGASVSNVSNSLRSVGSGTGSGARSDGFSVVGGVTYKVTATIKGDVAYDSIQLVIRRLSLLTTNISVTSIVPSIGTDYTTVTGYTTVTTTAADACLFIRFAGTEAINIDSISIKELHGLHARQTTSTARPIYGIMPETGIKNLLQSTADLANSVWLQIDTPSPVLDGALGGEPAFLLTDANSSSFAYIYQNYSAGVLAADNYVASIRIKKQTATTSTAGFRVNISDGVTTSYAGALIDPITGIPILELWSSGNRVITVYDRDDHWFVVVTLTVPANSYISSFQIFPAHNSVPPATSGAIVQGSQTFAAPQLTKSTEVQPYQRVDSLYSVTENGVGILHYLCFDGIDDYLFTSSISPGTNKAQLFAGARKLADTTGVIVETTNDVNANLGIFLGASVQASGVGRLSWGAGSSGVLDAYRTYVSPDSKVLSAILQSNAEPRISTRLNGVAVVADTTSGSALTGNFATSPLYIGRRAGTGLPFNGYLYSLVVRFGSDLTTNQIYNTELWINKKTGAY